MRGDRLFRITFSKSLAEHIAGDAYDVKRIDLKLGKPLLPGELSSTGLYAVVAKRRDRILRVSLIKDVAEMIGDDPSRYVAECWVDPITP